jgi:hypothetical protein
MIRWRILVLGIALFLAVHLLQIVVWREWFQPGGDYPPWFLNSGRAVAFTAGSLFAAGVVLGMVTRRQIEESIISGSNLAAGACLAMVAVLGIIGPGNLFPVALAIGAGIATVSAIAGTLAGRVIGRLNRSS